MGLSQKEACSKEIGSSQQGYTMIEKMGIQRYSLSLWLKLYGIFIKYPVTLLTDSSKEKEEEKYI